MRRIAALTTNPLVIALVLALAIAGCANKKTPNSAGRSRPRRRRRNAGLGAGLHRQCRRPHLLRHRLLGRSAPTRRQRWPSRRSG